MYERVLKKADRTSEYKKMSKGSFSGTKVKHFSKARKKVKSNRKNGKCFTNAGKWYEEFSDAPGKYPQPSNELVSKLKASAQQLLTMDSALFNDNNSKGSQKSDFQWMRTVMAKGTISDKIAAYTVLIQSSPVHNLPVLKNLVNMVKAAKKKECIMVIEVLVDLFLTDLLPQGRKLRRFEQNPLTVLNSLSNNNKEAQDKRLVYWYFEDQLKQQYMLFVQALNNVSHDSIDKSKQKAMSAMYKLLDGNPEKEEVLLMNIVNKLGDPSQQIASKAMYLLNQLLQNHPNMKIVVLEEIEKLLFRSNIGHKPQYYGICFLSQFYLLPEDNLLAKNLIRIYFSFFKASIKTGNIDSRMMSALLTGVNRAYPFAKEEMGKISEHVETVYRIVHLANFSVSLQALSLLNQVADYTNSVTDRFYTALYKKLLDHQLCNTTHHAMFLNLVYKSLKKDTDLSRVKAFIKRLLQICEYQPVPLVCGILCLISQLIFNTRELLTVKMEATAADDDGNDDEHYSDVKTEEDSSGNLPEQVNGHISEKSSGDILENGDIKNNVKSASWFHCQNVDTKHKQLSVHDPYQRNPVYSCGDRSVYVELLKLSRHFHPTVALFAGTILEGRSIDYRGDPLQDFTIIRFLDRFVFKNPKKNAEQQSAFTRKKGYIPGGIKTLRVNSNAYLNADETKIPVDELFMYNYLHKQRTLKGDKEDEDESDIESVDSDEFEHFINNALEGKKRNKEVDSAEEVSDEFGNDGEESPSQGSATKQKKAKKGGKRRKENEEQDIFNLPDVFASAEEFSEILEQTGASHLNMATSSEMSNKDKAAMRQLQWEDARHRWVAGVDKLIRKPQKRKFKPGKNYMSSRKKKRTRQ